MGSSQRIEAIRDVDGIHHGVKVGVNALNLLRPAGALGRRGALVFNNSFPQKGARHGARHLLAFASPLAFVCQKVEQPILLDWAAKRSAERVPKQARPDVRLAVLQFRVLIEIVVGYEVGRAVVLICRAMQLVGAALGQQLHLRAGRAPLVGACIGGGYAELFHGIQGGSQRARKGIALQLVVVVDAIQRDVGLVASRAVYGAATAVLVQIHLIPVSDSNHARLQTQNGGGVASLKRQRGDLRLVEGVADGGVGGIDGLHCRRHFHRGRHAGHLQYKIAGRWSSYQ